MIHPYTVHTSFKKSFTLQNFFIFHQNVINGSSSEGRDFFNYLDHLNLTIDYKLALRSASIPETLTELSAKPAAEHL